MSTQPNMPAKLHEQFAHVVGQTVYVRFYCTPLPPEKQGIVSTPASTLAASSQIDAKIIGANPKTFFSQLLLAMPVTAFGFSLSNEQVKTGILKHKTTPKYNEGPYYLLGEIMDSELNDGLEIFRSRYGVRIELDYHDDFIVLAPDFSQIRPVPSDEDEIEPASAYIPFLTRVVK